jgi:hypothetical protein
MEILTDDGSEKTKPNKANLVGFSKKNGIFYLTFIHRAAMYSKYWYSELEIRNWLFQKI